MRVILFALALALSTSAAPAKVEPKSKVDTKGKSETKDKPAKPVTVPFELLKSGHMAVLVKVNGKGPFKLIFDTGAPMSLVNNKLAKESGMLEGMPKPPFALFGAMGEGRMKTLEVGTAKAEDVPAVVMDHPTVEAISKKLGTEIHGLVGFPFFARFKMTIDYKAKTMTLAPSGYKPPDVMKMMNAVMLSAITGKSKAKHLAPAAQWGILANKEVGDEEAGVDVKEVVPGSSADKSGLKRGDRLLTLDGRWTDSLEDLYEAAGFVPAGTKVVVRIKRGGKEMDLDVTPAKGM